MHLTESVYGPFISRRHTRVYNEHFQDFSFSPQILKPKKNKDKIDYLQRRHLSMIDTGFIHEMDAFLMREIDEMRSIPLEDSYDRVKVNNHHQTMIVH